MMTAEDLLRRYDYGYGANGKLFADLLFSDAEKRAVGAW